MTKRRTNNTGDPGSSKRARPLYWVYHLLDGLRAHRELEHDEAVELYTQALYLEPDNPMILDCRASAYKAMQRWEDAYKDVDLMIQKHPDMSLGYLSMGRLLENRPTLAREKQVFPLDVYRQGCRQVPPADPRYEQLVFFRDSLASKRDPIFTLPLDVLDNIFGLIPFHLRIDCVRVSRSWAAFLRSWHGMWADLDFVTGANESCHNCTVSSLEAYLQYAKGRHVRRFAWSSRRGTMEWALLELKKHQCQNLDQLWLYDYVLPRNSLTPILGSIGGNLTQLLISECPRPTGSMVVHDILSACPRLTRLYCSWTRLSALDCLPAGPEHGLERLHLVIDSSCCQFLASLAARCPHLTHLYMKDDLRKDDMMDRLGRSWFPKLRVLYQAGGGGTLPVRDDVAADTLLPPRPREIRENGENVEKDTGLQELSVFARYFYDDDAMARLINQLLRPNIHTLSILWLPLIQFGRQWVQLLPASTQLTRLHLPTCDSLSEQDYLHILSLYPRLECLMLAGKPNVTDRVLYAVADLPYLRELDISHNASITDLGVIRLIEKRETTLTKLVMFECTALQPQCIQLARARLGNRFICISSRYRSYRPY
ncbi:hypothetical protein BC940DRAFT_300185 [Gongronella butleri]|nr:hypothetical protein BC940DRAFT_300185 [Gongronella butleri]